MSDLFTYMKYTNDVTSAWYARTHTISHASKNSKEQTYLMYACKHKLKNTIQRFLQSPTKCNLHETDIYDNTALIYACKNKLTYAIEIISNYSANCNMEQKNNDGYTALMYLCQNKLGTHALQLLQTPNYCNLHSVCHNNHNALYYACTNKLSVVALALLPYMMNHITKELFSEIYNNKMFQVIDYILKNIDETNAIQFIGDLKDDPIRQYLFDKNTSHRKQIENYHNNIFNTKKSDKPMHEMCIGCWDNDKDIPSYYLEGCHHIIKICGTCIIQIRKCPICRSPCSRKIRSFIV